MISAFVKTYGCQANVADSSNLERYLSGIGCQIVTSESEADLILINSCAIRKKAEDKMFSYLGDLLQHKEDRPYIKIGVIGCVASYRKDYILGRFKHVDFSFGARKNLDDFKANLADTISSIESKKNLYYQDSSLRESPKEKNGSQQKSFKRSMINIMRGCNNYCSYCIVPFTTGRERSFSMAGIIDTIKKDVDAGAKEITLLGQNVNSYIDPDSQSRFEDLLSNVAKIDGDFWVRFVSPHPKDITKELLHVIASSEKLCPYIHLPLQSGSNKILNLMNRTYSKEEYMNKVYDIQNILPHATMTTDIIVGFPSEAESDYIMTREVMEEVKFNTIFSFIYSPRKYTKAADMEDNCSYEVKLDRLKQLQKRQREIGTEVNRKLIGKTIRVLVEGRLNNGTFWGRNDGNVKVLINGKVPEINTFVDVSITEARLSDISGVL